MIDYKRIIRQKIFEAGLNTEGRFYLTMPIIYITNNGITEEADPYPYLNGYGTFLKNCEFDIAETENFFSVVGGVRSFYYPNEGGKKFENLPARGLLYYLLKKSNAEFKYGFMKTGFKDDANLRGPLKGFEEDNYVNPADMNIQFRALPNDTLECRLKNKEDDSLLKEFKVPLLDHWNKLSSR